MQLYMSGFLLVRYSYNTVYLNSQPGPSFIVYLYTVFTKRSAAPQTMHSVVRLRAEIRTQTGRIYWQGHQPLDLRTLYPVTSAPAITDSVFVLRF